MERALDFELEDLDSSSATQCLCDHMQLLNPVGLTYL